jgi:hypothetical protein
MSLFILGVGITLGSFATSATPRQSVAPFVATFACFASLHLLHRFQTPKPWPSWSQRLLHTGSDDVIFSEAFAFVVDLQGPFLNAGDSTQWMYHWLSLAWSGSMSRMLNLEPLTMSLLVAPTVGYIAIFFLAKSILEPRIKSNFLPIFVIIAIFLLSSLGFRITAIFVENTSNIFGFVWLLASIKVLLDLSSATKSLAFTRYIALALLIAATALAKAPYAVTLLFILFFRILALYKSSEMKPRRTLCIDLAVCTAASASTYLVFLRESDGVGTSFEFGLRSLVDQPNSLLQGLALTIFWIGIRIMPLFIPKLGITPSTDRQLNSLMYGVPAAIALDLILDSNSDIYFTNAAIAVAGLGIAPAMAGAWQHLLQQSLRGKLQLLSIVALFSLLVLPLNQEALNQIRQVSNLITYVSLLVMAGALVTVWSIRTRLSETTSVPLSFFATLIIFSVVIGLGGRALQVGELPLRSGSPTPEEFAAMSAVRALTDETSVIASNFGICGLDNCSQDDYRRLFIPAIGQRNSYVVAIPEVLNRKLPAEVVSRLELTLAYAVESQHQTTSLLAEEGVTHYLLALKRGEPVPNARDFGNQAHEIFRNGVFVLIQLGNGR